MTIDGQPVKKIFENGILHEFVYEGKRVGPLLILALILLTPDISDLLVAIYAVGVVILASAIAQIVRRIIVPYLSLERLVRKVENSSLASAIVISATFWMFIQILQTIAVMFK